MILVCYFVFVAVTVGFSAIVSYLTGNWWFFGSIVAIFISCTFILSALLFFPPLVMWLRGYGKANGLWRDGQQNDWKTAFAPRSHIERVLTYSVMSQVIPKPPTAIYEWLGSDARRVFTGIEQASRRETGGRFRVNDQLADIKAADIRDFDTLLGYFEVASIDASIYAVKEDIPIDYAKAMFP